MGNVARLSGIDSRRRHLVAAALAPDLLIGMPHLTPSGLSETWLLKELAHRHWLLLGQAMGLDDADFRLPDGSEVYAAICASALRDAQFAAVQANDILTISSSLSPVGRTRMASQHRLWLDSRAIGTVELLSAFVHRQDGTIARVRQPAFEAPGSAFAPSRIADRAALVSRGELVAAGLPQAPGVVLRSYGFTPSPLQDFNGADLFYFANYQAVIDRAMQHWFGTVAPLAHKQTYYVGNIAAGESIVVKLLDGPGRPVVIERADGRPIAYQTTIA